MFLKSVSLQNFRNYSKKKFEFGGLTTLVVGPNTSGKTNLLEAIYLLATGKSFRAEVEGEMIAYGQEVARISAVVAQFIARPSGKSSEGGKWEARSESGSGKREVRLEILLTTGLVSGKKVAKKRYQVNDVGKRMIDFVGQLKAVYFGPEDLQLVTDSPSLRRRYLDMVLSQVDREYRRASLSYEKGLRQRNRILEELRGKEKEGEIKRRLYFWDQLLVKNGNYITEKREEMIDFVNARRGKPRQGKTLRVEDPKPEGLRNWQGWARPPASSLAGEVGRGIGEQAASNFQLEYVKSVISPMALEENFGKEIILGMTLVGPHRDDIKFETRNTKHETREGEKAISSTASRVPCPVSPRDLSIYGSRGEQRLAVLWLKIGELEFIAEKTEQRPVLLLDDIFSELDKEHRETVLKVLGKQQTIMTTTDEDIIPKEAREKMEIIRL